MYGFLKTLQWISEGNKNEVEQAQAEELERWRNELTGNTEQDKFVKEIEYMNQNPEIYYNGEKYVKYSMYLSVFSGSKITFALSQSTIICLMENKSYIVESNMGGKGLTLSEWTWKSGYLKEIKDWTNCMNSRQ